LNKVAELQWNGYIVIAAISYRRRISLIASSSRHAVTLFVQDAQRKIQIQRRQRLLMSAEHAKERLLLWRLIEL